MATFDLHGHGRTFAAEYPPSANSDHLPMAWLALQGLGADRVRQEAFARHYIGRLQRLDEADPQRARVDAAAEAMGRRGMTTVLEERLPAVVSGWYREAYHPLIRLAYGAAFGIIEEAAAGLAYLEASGPSPQLERLASGARYEPDLTGTDLLARLTGASPHFAPAARFDARAERLLATNAARPAAVVLDDNLRTMSESALNAFAATGDFFALHLVTGSHAFRIVSPWVGGRADAVLNLGLALGYLAIGAPAFSRAATTSPPPDQADLLAACGDDEHDIKIAYTAWDQAAHWGEPRYLAVVADYLASRRDNAPA